MLLDVVGEKVRAAFGLTAEEMPLVKVLEGGTWKVCQLEQDFRLCFHAHPYLTSGRSRNCGQETSCDARTADSDLVGWNRVLNRTLLLYKSILPVS
jgi:hypothetical protein